MQAAEIVIIPAGSYKLSATVDILAAYKVQRIIGQGRQSSKLYFVGTDGITNNKSGVIIEGVGIFGNSTLSTQGVKVLRPLQMKNFQIQTFGIGIGLANNVHIITSYFEKGVVSYNKSYGVKVVSGATHQNNAITFKELYMVKNGASSDILTTDATTTDGDGIYIDGCYGILIQNCVFEYNTGCGLRVEKTNYHVYGLSVISPYFERNKYANVYVNNTNGAYTIKGLAIFGDFYTEAGHALVANALSERKIYVSKPNLISHTFNGNYMGQYSFSDRTLLNRRANFLNAFPVNFMQDLETDYPDNIVVHNGEKVFTLTNTIKGKTLYSELMSIDPTMDYVFSYEIKKVGVTASPSVLVILRNHATNDIVLSVNTYMGTAAAFDWTTKTAKVTGLSSVNRLVLYVGIEGTKPDDEEVYIRNIRMIPILKNNITTGITEDRPTKGLLEGYSFYDTALGKPIWWNGTAWTDSAGTVV